MAIKDYISYFETVEHGSVEEALIAKYSITSPRRLIVIESIEQPTKAGYTVLFEIDKEKTTELDDFDKYQIEARKTAVYPDLGNNLWYPALGLNGEAGEVAEKVKKIYRDKGGKLPKAPDMDAFSIGTELGDVLWYIANLATELGFNLSDIAVSNLEKLASRAARDKVHGEGDNR